jgi:Holliday junction resolvasome RuvABC endonuclease subunit
MSRDKAGQLIIGIDPGVTTGVAFVRRAGGRCSAVEAHTIANDELCSEATIFTKTYYTLSELLKRGEVNVVVGIEGPTKGKFVDFLTLQILGIVKFAVAEADLGWQLMPVKTVKKRVTGNGNAKKLEVLRAVEEALGIGLDVTNLHISDAYAVCLALAEEI